MRRWLLPEAIEDILPHEARRVESLRHRLLEACSVHGYELVFPPLIEYVESLLTGSGRDMDLRTFRLVDQLSGRAMGLRADITPQVARIDSHLLNRQGVARLCYCGPVVHAVPDGFQSTREPLQLGAEIYGHAGIEADIEVVRLLARVLELAEVPASRIDLGHVGLFRALAAELNGSGGQALEQDLFSALQAKDVPGIEGMLSSAEATLRQAFICLAGLYGDADVLERARRELPDWPSIRAALDDLCRLSAALGDLPLGFDLADLRGYHYHSGVVLAAYCVGEPQAIARGGRYDEVGRCFGRARPATGFSLDLRQLARVSPADATRSAILAPVPGDAGLRQAVVRLRQAGEVVIEALPGHDGSWAEAGCTRELVKDSEGGWVVRPLD